ncbi:MAG: hypothetical protein JOZ54_10945 [Acidobacteria bacterium]|nr:hypothetical protein [Acidobacteriota bacterium]
MKKAVFVFAAIAVMAFSSSAIAQCNSSTASSGSFVEYSYRTLTSAASNEYPCWTFNGSSSSTSIPATTLASFTGSPAGFKFEGFAGHITRQFTVPSGAGGHWEIDAYVELVDPHSSTFNSIQIYGNVYRSGALINGVTIYSHSGNQGSATGVMAGQSFTGVQAGDVIEIDIVGSWSTDSDSWVKVSNVRLFNLIP